VLPIWPTFTKIDKLKRIENRSLGKGQERIGLNGGKKGLFCPRLTDIFWQNAQNPVLRRSTPSVSEFLWARSPIVKVSSTKNLGSVGVERKERTFLSTPT